MGKWKFESFSYCSEWTESTQLCDGQVPSPAWAGPPWEDWNRSVVLNLFTLEDRGLHLMLLTSDEPVISISLDGAGTVLLKHFGRVWSTARPGHWLQWSLATQLLPVLGQPQPCFYGDTPLRRETSLSGSPGYRALSYSLSFCQALCVLTLHPSHRSTSGRASFLFLLETEGALQRRALLSASLPLSSRGSASFLPHHKVKRNW